MRFRTLLAVALAFAALPAAAKAQTTIVEPPGSAVPYQQWADTALVPTPATTLTVIEEACPDHPDDFAWACTSNGSYTIWIGGRRRERHTFLHELGHNFDYYVLSDWARSRFQRLIEYSAAEWLGPANSPGERFAEAYARCAELGPSYSGDPDLTIRGIGMGGLRSKVYRKICRMIVSLGRSPR